MSEDTVCVTDEVRIDISDITNADIDGQGAFDILMKAVSSHIDSQFKTQRITGNDYATVYINALQAALQGGIQFALSKCKTQAEINLINAQATKALWDAKTAEVQYLIAEATLKRTNAEVQLMRQRVVTEQAQTDGTVILPESILDHQRILLERQSDGFLRDAEQKAASILWDIYKVQISVGENVDPGVSGATEGNMKKALQKVMAGINVTIT